MKIHMSNIHVLSIHQGKSTLNKAPTSPELLFINTAWTNLLQPEGGDHGIHI